MVGRLCGYRRVWYRWGRSRTMAEATVRVVICDDQWIVCQGLEAILGADPVIEVVGIAHDGQEALDRVAETKPDVVLMDLRMPVMNGIQATQRIAREHPSTKVLVLTTYGADEWVFDAIRSGAAGYLLKDSAFQIAVDKDPMHAGLIDFENKIFIRNIGKERH